VARQYAIAAGWGPLAVQETGRRTEALNDVALQETTSTGGAAYTLTITPSAVPIGGSVVAPLLAFAETITPSAVPIGGAAVAPVYARSISLAPSAVPITGAAVVPFSTIAYATTIAASVPVPPVGRGR
jgi:hypothetical protein